MSGALRTPVPNIPLTDAMGQLWALGTADQGGGVQAILVEVVSGGSSNDLTPTNVGDALAVGGTAETVLTVTDATRYVVIQNPPDAASQGIGGAENLFVALGASAVVNGAVNFAVLAPGQSCVIGFQGARIATGTTVTVNAATTGHIYVATRFAV